MNRQFQIERMNHIRELFESNRQLFDTSLIPEIKIKGISKVIAELPLRHHFHHGDTILYINEKLDEAGNIEEFRYGWELSQKKERLSKAARHITAFDKQTHPEPPHNVKTDPYHHHHVPGDITKRKETSVQTLEDVIGILSDYMVGNFEYNEKHSF